MDNKRLAEDLLKKYLSGSASPEESEQVENWYRNYDYNNTELSHDKKNKIGVRMQNKLQQHMQKQSKSTLLVIKTSPFLRVAASIIIIFCIGLGTWKFGHLFFKNANNNPPQFVFATKNGEQKTIVLSDGSEITLSAASRITYPKKFSATCREINLTEGEAFFKIAHDINRPFTVKLPGNLYTKVLGTSFKIRAFKALAELKVSVNTGKVAVGNKNQLFGTLIKGQQITYNKIHQSAIIAPTPIVDSKIIFEKTDLRQVIQQLEYLYSIKIELATEKLGDLGCTATFHTLQTPDQILDIICSLHNIKFKSTSDHKSFKIYRK